MLSESVSVKLNGTDGEIALDIPTKDENGYFSYELPLTGDATLVINGGATPAP